MTRKSGFKTWPPVWTTPHHDKDDKPIGEVGSLEDVMMRDLIDNKVFMLSSIEACDTGCMGFDEPPFCHEIYRLLKHHLGRSTKEIGDLDLSYTL